MGHAAKSRERVLLQNTIFGMPPVMPPRGLCGADSELDGIDFMIHGKQGLGIRFGAGVLSERQCVFTELGSFAQRYLTASLSVHGLVRRFLYALPVAGMFRFVG